MANANALGEAMFFAPILLLMCAGVTYLFSTNRLLRQLREKHRTAWKGLGRPEIERFSPRATSAFLRLMWSRRADAIEDEAFQSARRAWKFSAIGFALGMILLAIMAWSALLLSDG